MFHHILIPTDGSPASDAAAMSSIQLAHRLGARVTALHVTMPFHVFTWRSEMLEDTREEYEDASRRQSDRFLGFIAKTAAESAVPCEAVRMEGDDAFQAIIDAARERGCDLIAMASHGWKGVAGMLLGSETQKVLTHCHIPVLVWR